jgi:beta-lactamase class D
LDVGAVKSIDDFVPYEVTQYTTSEAFRPFIYGGGRERASEWNRQMELRKAIRMSSTPIFRKLARLVGEERMRAGITKLAYGNMEIGHEVNRFWRDGSLQISAVEQAEFLARLAQGRLPVTLKALEQTKELTLREKTAVQKLHFKSGLLSPTGPRVGWWVGWIERENEVFSFALNIDMTNSADAQTLAAIGRDCLRAVGKL